VKQHKVDAVASYKLDRLFRDASDCLIVTKSWDQTDTALHLIDMGGQAIDTTSAMGRFFLTVMAGAAEMERNLIRERTLMGFAYKRKNNERLGSIPYGCRLNADGIHLEFDSDEQRIIGWIKQGKGCGWSLYETADWLNAHKIKARGKRWHVTTIRRVLLRAKKEDVAKSTVSLDTKETG
jgi:DNA invertase Pin-like site-specific DNA recombinase